ncbi:YebW family protein [Pseudescherichia sp. L3]|uniref:YebW family protein n=1 Tax=Pseudescherichia sp. L3 TaxID=2970817 RepID=UPI0021501966|nr:YebW family protein [Pseudescherichia sp. L3]MCR4457614.1 YebW family protein [Pseudescherichia sp. L3]
MNTLFALVLTVGMTNGDFQDVVLGVYKDQRQCEAAAVEQHVAGECFEVERIIRNGEQPAVTL